MARTLLAGQSAPDTGRNPTYAAANVDGFMFQNYGHEVLMVKNGGVASINVTIATPRTVGGLSLADRVVAVPAGEERWIGNLSPGLYNRGSSDTPDPNMTYVDFSAVTSVTVALVNP